MAECQRFRVSCLLGIEGKAMSSRVVSCRELREKAEGKLLMADPKG